MGGFNELCVGIGRILNGGNKQRKRRKKKSGRKAAAVTATAAEKEAVVVGVEKKALYVSLRDHNLILYNVLKIFIISLS